MEVSDEKLAPTASRPGRGPLFTPAASPQEAFSHFMWGPPALRGWIQEPGTCQALWPILSRSFHPQSWEAALSSLPILQIK